MSAGYATVIGRLRHRLIIQEVTTTVDAIGAENIAYSTTQTVWGSVVGMNGREQQVAAQVSPHSSHIIRIRYNSAINESCRILHNGHIYNIDFINNIDSRNKVMTLYCQEDRSPRGVV